MRAYLVTRLNGEGKPAAGAYVGSEAEARQQRNKWMESFGLPRKSFRIEQIDIPTTKVELLAFLNKELEIHG